MSTDAPPQTARRPKPAIVDLGGTTLDSRYRVVHRLGAGGMGAVYLAEHTSLGKKQAIKVLTQDPDRPELAERFLREARATSRIEQQNVIEISDFGETPDGSIYFVMEYLDGEDLRALIKRERRLPWARVRHLAVQICRALAAAHATGIVHRDMKPDNCYRVTRDGDPDFVKVLDFGIAKIHDGPETRGLTKTGMIIGTAEYMAPEQARGELDPRSDIYAVGVIMYELLCGRVPFKDKNYVKVLTKHMFNAPKPPSVRAPDAGIPPDAEAVVLKAMQKDPALRFQTMAEMIAAIEAVGTGAAAVMVVHEDVVRPDMSGSMSFHGQQSSASMSASHSGSGSGSHSGVAPGGPATDEREGLPAVLWIGVAGLGLAAVLGVLAAVGVFDEGASDGQVDEAAVAGPAKPTAAEQDPAVAKAEPNPEPAPEPAPAPAQPDVDASIAELSFETNVPVAILAAEDRALLGRSDGVSVEVPRSEQPLALILAAEGYRELEIEIVPNTEAKTFELELEPLGAGKPGGKKRKRKKVKAKPQVDDGDADDSEVKNPFLNK